MSKTLKNIIIAIVIAITMIASFNVLYDIKFHNYCEKITWGDHYATFNCNF